MKEAINRPDLDFDRQHIWHPYSTMIAPPPVYPVVGARGSRLTLAEAVAVRLKPAQATVLRRPLENCLPAAHPVARCRL